MVTDLLYHFTYNIIPAEHIQCMPCSSQIISEMLPEIHTIKMLFSQTYNSLSNNLILCLQPYGEILLFLTDFNKEEGRNENDRVAAPESPLIHL